MGRRSRSAPTSSYHRADYPSEDPAAQVGRWLGRRLGSGGNLTPEQVSNVLPDVEPEWIAAAEAEWRERRGWVYGSFERCFHNHREWAAVVKCAGLVERKKDAPVVALAGLQEDAEVRVAWWNGGTTVLVTKNDSLDVAVDWKVARGEGRLHRVTVWVRREPEPWVADFEDDDSEPLL